MENLTSDVNVYLSNEIRLQQVKEENDILLQRTKHLETKINRCKQLGETPCKKDESVLNAMVCKSLYLLAERDTLITVGTSLISQRVLQKMIQNRYQYLLHRFRLKLYYKRLERSKHIKRLHHVNFDIV